MAAGYEEGTKSAQGCFTEHTEKARDVVIACIVGAPGSGKTSLCVALAKDLQDCIVISVDAVFDKSLDSFEHATDITAVEELRASTAELWHSARQEVLAESKRAIAEQQYSFILIDDTCHLPSMRKPFFHLAQQGTKARAPCVAPHFPRAHSPYRGLQVRHDSSGCVSGRRSIPHSCARRQQPGTCICVAGHGHPHVLQPGASFCQGLGATALDCHTWYHYTVRISCMLAAPIKSREPFSGEKLRRKQSKR